jgi:uncharacterized protein YybS (DUF2232 family)
MKFRPVLFAVIQTVGLFVAGFVIPVLGQLAALFTPVPLILVYVDDRRKGVISLIVSSTIIGILGGWHVAAVFILSFGLMALGVSEGIQRRWRPESAALLGALLPLAVLAIVGGYYFYRIGKNPLGAIEEFLKSNLTEAGKVYTQLGFTDLANAIASISDSFLYNIVRLIPGILIATTVFQAASCYGLSLYIMIRKLKAPQVTDSISFAAWHAPDVWVWGLIAGLSLIMVPGEAAWFTGWNLAVIFAVVYLTQGVAIVDYYLKKARVQPFIRGLLHTIILALPSVVFVIALGVVDIWADFRKVRGPVKAA